MADSSVSITSSGKKYILPRLTKGLTESATVDEVLLAMLDDKGPRRSETAVIEELDMIEEVIPGLISKRLAALRSAGLVR